MPEEIQTIKTLAELVQQMRDAQNKFFADRTKTSLRLAKVLESRVDGLCKQLTADNAPPAPEASQPNLFY